MARSAPPDASPSRASSAPASPSSTKARILESARALVLADGLDALSMRRVAERAGVGTMTTYRHFTGKDDLVDHLVLDGFARFRGYFYRALEEATAFARLQACAEHYLRFALDHPKDYELMFMAPRGSAGPSAEGAEQVAAALRFLVDRVRECQATPGPPARETALTLWSHCHGLVSLHLAGRYAAALDFPRFYRRSTSAVLAGLGFLPSTTALAEEPS